MPPSHNGIAPDLRSGVFGPSPFDSGWGRSEFLDDVYRDKWLILVSNKNLVKKYNEFGTVSTRKNLRKQIEKWVKETENKRK